MNEYKKLATECRKKVLEMIHRAGTSHIASNFSVIDIVTVLYENLKEKDCVVWSKGWAAATIYYFLAKQGKIPVEDLEKFPNEPYLGLAETSVNGVWVSGGSMGHGLPVAVGMALAKKRSGEKGTIFCIMSDGELNEGTTWESAAIAGHHKLNNLVVMVDKNGWQAMGKTEEVLDFGTSAQVCNKWGQFGWHPRKVKGHYFEELERAIFSETPILSYRNLPLVVIAETVKGKGVSFFENHILYHYKHVEKDEFKKAMEELNRPLELV